MTSISPTSTLRSPAAPRQAALSDAEQAEVRKLKARDTVVRQHEQAHLAAAGGLATSGASYSFQKGPDGVNYAVGGEVSIDTSKGGSPEETERRAQTLRAAALAPADPSAQDRSIAAEASRMEMQAAQELAQQARSAESGGATDRGAEIARYYGSAVAGSAGIDVQA